VFHEVVNVSAAMVAFAALEVRLSCQLEHRVAGQVLSESGARSTSPAFHRSPHPWRVAEGFYNDRGQHSHVDGCYPTAEIVK
jgi:hypothetical protein